MTAPKNPKPLGFPVSIPADQVFENLRLSREADAMRASRRARGSRPVTAELHAIVTPAFGPPRSAPARPASKVERFKLSYLVGDTTPSSVDLNDQDIAGPMLLEVTEIECYDHNPRLFLNEKREDIRNSIASTGFQDALVVTRRRPGDRFMLAAGSNTALQILQELFRQTQDEKHRWVNCIFQPYLNDARVLSQHLGENLNRGDMRFWEIAKGMTNLLDMIAAERKSAAADAKDLGLREQADELTKRGLRAEKSLVALWRFSVRRLEPLGPGLQGLTLRSVRDHLQPRLNALRALALKFKLEEQAFWTSIVSPALSAAGRAFDPDAFDATFDAVGLCDRVEAAFAEHVDEPVGSVRQMLSTLKVAPELTLADLRQPSPNILFGGRGAAMAREVNSVAGDDDEARTASAPTLGEQAPLPLGPGVVRAHGKPPAPTAGLPPIPIATADAVAPVAPPWVPATVSELPTAAADLQPGQLQASRDPLAVLNDAVRSLLSIAGLADILRSHDDMPLGFYIELPDREQHARHQVAVGSPDYHQRSVKTMVWWSLVLMTGQLREGCLPFMDHGSAFFSHFAANADASALHGTDIRHGPPELDEVQMARIALGPMRAAMQQMRVVEDLASRVFEQAPDRWRRMLLLQGTQT